MLFPVSERMELVAKISYGMEDQLLNQKKNNHLCKVNPSSVQ